MRPFRMNGHRIRAEKVPELRVKNASCAQKLTVVRDQRHATTRHVRDQDPARNTFRAPDMAEFPWSLPLPPDHLSHAGRKVDQVDLAALRQGETAVRKEEAGYDRAQFAEVRMLRRIESGLARWAQSGEKLR